ncbi:AbgT family transporter [Lentzea sp. E54]|uniref:AbgT family transporter n=1 Tax=Lentzea xerophila TaxID=3435883 RepID=UPI003DA4E903
MAKAPWTRPAKRVFSSALEGIERVGNRLPDPFMLFVYLFAVLAVVSTVFAALGTTVTIPGTSKPIAIRGLFTGDGAEFLITKMIENFIEFPPLGNVLLMLMAVGVAERTGLLKAVVRAALTRVSGRVLPYAVAFVGFQAHVMSDVSMIVIPPLAALLFREAGRHPVAGLIGGFACVSGGYGAGLLLGSSDALLAGITSKAVDILPMGTGIDTHIAMNWFFTAASGLVLPFVGGWITAHIVEPRLGTYQDIEAGDDEVASGLDPVERRGLRNALITLAVYLLVVFGGWLVPGSPLRGDNGAFVPSPFLSGLVPILFVAFLATGIVYGLSIRAVTSNRDVPRLMADSVKEVAGYIVLIFAVSQFIALFSWTNVGSLLAVKSAEALTALGLTGFGGILLFVALASMLNLFIISGSAMWSLMAPVFIPAFLLLGFEPGLVQAAFRIGDSATQIITPMNPYLLVLLTFVRKYQPGTGLGTLMARLSIYVIPFWVFWAALLAVFYFAEIPVGPGTPIHLPH